jgi:hypothetical protein
MEGRLPETVLKGGAGSGVLRPRLVTAGSGGPGLKVLRLSSTMIKSDKALESPTILWMDGAHGSPSSMLYATYVVSR